MKMFKDMEFSGSFYRVERWRLAFLLITSHETFPSALLEADSGADNADSGVDTTKAAGHSLQQLQHKQLHRS